MAPAVRSGPASGAARREAARPDLLAAAKRPDHAAGAHAAPLGLAFHDAAQFPAGYRDGALVGPHGPADLPSAQRLPGRPGCCRGWAAGGTDTRFADRLLSPANEADGRLVGVAVDRTGALLVAENVCNRIWRVSR